MWKTLRIKIDSRNEICGTVDEYRGLMWISNSFCRLVKVKPHYSDLLETCCWTIGFVYGIVYRACCQYAAAMHAGTKTLWAIFLFASCRLHNKIKWRRWNITLLASCSIIFAVFERWQTTIWFYNQKFLVPWQHATSKIMKIPPSGVTWAFPRSFTEFDWHSHGNSCILILTVRGPSVGCERETDTQRTACYVQTGLK
jgi:hypothetical protein